MSAAAEGGGSGY